MRYVIGIGVVMMLGVASQAPAALITFTHEGSGSGTLDFEPFPVSDFVITAVGDNDDRVSFVHGFYIQHISASISIDGVGTFDFISDTLTFVNNYTFTVGFSRVPATDLFDGPTDPIFGNWDMQSSIGPVSGTGDLLQWNFASVITTGGVLYFNLADTVAIFTASKIPAPSGLALFAVATMGVGPRRRRHACRKQCPTYPDR